MSRKWIVLYWSTSVFVLWTLKVQANVQNIPRIFNKVLNKSAPNRPQNIPWNNPPYAADSCDFIPSKIEYSYNIVACLTGT